MGDLTILDRVVQLEQQVLAVITFQTQLGKDVARLMDIADAREIQSAKNREKMKKARAARKPVRRKKPGISMDNQYNSKFG